MQNKIQIFIFSLGLGFALPILAEGDPWEEVDSSLWLRDFTGSKLDGGIAIPTADLKEEGIGKGYSVLGLFDHWDLNDKAAGGRTVQYAEVTRECKGKIEPEYALTAEQWRDPAQREKHFQDLDHLMDKVGNILLSDFKERLPRQELDLMLLSFHALSWQETHWENFIRYKDWFFVVLSGGSYNKLEDWGITQVARSSKDPTHLSNKNFFDQKAYCSIGSTIYYGFLEFYFHIRAARKIACNNGSAMNAILGAYNQYASGVSLCYNGFSEDPDFRNYQKRALAGFTNAMNNKPWLEKQN